MGVIVNDISYTGESGSPSKEVEVVNPTLATAHVSFDGAFTDFTDPAPFRLHGPDQVDIKFPTSDSPSPVVVIKPHPYDYSRKNVFTTATCGNNGELLVTDQRGNTTGYPSGVSRLIAQLGDNHNCGDLVTVDNDGDIIDLGQIKGIFTDWGSAEQVGHQIGDILEFDNGLSGIDRAVIHDVRNLVGLGETVPPDLLDRLTARPNNLKPPISIHDILRFAGHSGFISLHPEEEQHPHILPRDIRLVSRFLLNTLGNARQEGVGRGDVEVVVGGVGEIFEGERIRHNQPLIAVCSRTHIPDDIFDLLGRFGTTTKDGENHGIGLASLAVEAFNEGQMLGIARVKDSGRIDSRRLTGFGNTNGYIMNDLRMQQSVLRLDQTSRALGRVEDQLAPFMKAHGFSTAFFLTPPNANSTISQQLFATTPQEKAFFDGTLDRAIASVK